MLPKPRLPSKAETAPVVVWCLDELVHAKHLIPLVC